MSEDRIASLKLPNRLGGLTGLRLVGVIALLALAALFPVLFPSPVDTNYGVYALIFVAVASAWNIFSGFSGYISLGHAVFFGSGAYTLGIAARDWHVSGTGVFALMPLSALAGAVIAVPFGLIALRVRRHTFIVITIAVFFIFQLMAFNFSFTGGSTGLDAPFLPWQAQTYNNPFYYIALACAVGTIAIAWLIRRSRFGLQLRAIRDDEDRARGLGVKAMRVKLTALVLSAAVTGLVGAVWFLYLTQVQPPSGFDPLFDLSVVLMAFLGGLGTVSGPVLGALIIEPGQLYLTANSNGYISEILLGSLFLVAVLLVPRGIIPTGGEYLRRLTTRGRPAVPEGVPASQRGPASQRAPAPPGLRSDEGATREDGALKAARRRAGGIL
jgi:branched-chain amino acid transport system permease protein